MPKLIENFAHVVELHDGHYALNACDNGKFGAVYIGQIVINSTATKYVAMPAKDLAHVGLLETPGREFSTKELAARWLAERAQEKARRMARVN